jgi:hypothetical protein
LTIYEVIQIMNIFRIKLRLDCTIHNDYPRIYIKKNSMVTLIKLVSPYIIPSMQYKLKGVKK